MDNNRKAKALENFSYRSGTKKMTDEEQDDYDMKNYSSEAYLQKLTERLQKADQEKKMVQDANMKRSNEERDQRQNQRDEEWDNKSFGGKAWEVGKTLGKGAADLVGSGINGIAGSFSDDDEPRNKQRNRSSPTDDRFGR